MINTSILEKSVLQSSKQVKSISFTEHAGYVNPTGDDNQEPPPVVSWEQRPGFADEDALDDFRDSRGRAWDAVRNTTKSRKTHVAVRNDDKNKGGTPPP